MLIDGKIYKIVNRVNGKVYIGQTKGCVRRRFSVHMCLSSSNHCSRLKKAVKKYGKEKFEIEIIDTASCVDDLNKKEIFWIDKFDSVRNGYNIVPGGGNYEITEEHKSALRVSASKRKDFYEKLGRINSEKLLGKKQTHEMVENRRKSLLNTYRKKGKYNNKKAFKKVVQYNIDGKKIRVFDSINSARDSLNLKSSSGITSVCRGYRNHCAGFQWRYESEGIAILEPVQARDFKQISAQNIYSGEVKIYHKISEACLSLNLRASYINRVLSGERQSSHGYIFRHV